MLRDLNKRNGNIADLKWALLCCIITPKDDWCFSYMKLSCDSIASLFGSFNSWCSFFIGTNFNDKCLKNTWSNPCLEIFFRRFYESKNKFMSKNRPDILVQESWLHNIWNTCIRFNLQTIANFIYSIQWIIATIWYVFI